MQFKTDKRSVKTRKAIKLAFLKLVKTKEISEITITEITQNAGINRNSFYTHYKNVNNILDDINNEIYLFMEEIMAKYTYSKITIDPYSIITEFTKVILNNKYITQYLLFSKSSNELSQKLKDNVCDRFYESYLKENPNVDPYIRYVISYIISGVFEMYYVWFKNGKDLPIEEISNKIATLILNGVSAFAL